MQTLADLNLPYLPLEDYALASDPYTYFAEARAQHPWLAKSHIGLVVHEYQAIRDLLSMDEKIRPGFDGIVDQLDARGTPWGRFTDEQLIALPTDQHRRLRDTFAAKFTPRYANQLRSVMQVTVQRLLDEWLPKGKFDFEEFASYFPISVTFSMIGAPHDEIAGIRQSLETLGLAFSMDKTRMPAVQKAYLHIEDLVLRLISERRANPGSGSDGDLLDLLIATQDGGAIAERQLVDMIIFLFIAGYDTSKNVLTFIMHQLIQRPEMYRRCATDREYCYRVVEEALRYYSPTTPPRLTSEDLVYRDVLLPKNTMLLFTVNISGRDPQNFDDPDSFNPERHVDPAKRHIAFGVGKHMCLGQHIARAQLQEALHLISQQILDPRLTGKVGWRPFPGLWGLKGLPIEFTHAKAV